MGSAVTITPDPVASAPVTITPDTAPSASVSSGASQGFFDSVKQWSENVANDIKHGTDITGVGTVLKKMGAHGVYSGNSEAVGDFMASLPLGLAKMTKGGGELGEGQGWQATKDIIGGGLQAATIPSAFAAPEGAEAVAKGGEEALDAASALSRSLRPAALKEDAGQLFSAIAKDANQVPVTLNNSADAALKLMDWQKKTQLGPTINKFLNRITSGKQGDLTYEEGRDFYSLLSRMSADEQSKLAGPVKYQIQKLTAGLKQDIGDAADTVGHAADYYKAMGDYARAMKLQDWYELAKKYAIRGAVAAAGWGLVGAGARFAKEGLGQ